MVNNIRIRSDYCIVAISLGRRGIRRIGIDCLIISWYCSPYRMEVGHGVS